GQVADGDVGEAFVEIRQQLVAGRRQDVDGERALAQLLLVLDVEVTLPVADQLDRDAALAPLVVEIERARERRIDADDVPLEHLVEVAGPRLVADLELSPLGRSWGRALGVACGHKPEHGHEGEENARTHDTLPCSEAHSPGLTYFMQRATYCATGCDPDKSYSVCKSTISPSGRAAVPIGDW